MEKVWPIWYGHGQRQPEDRAGLGARQRQTRKLDTRVTQRTPFEHGEMMEIQRLQQQVRDALRQIEAIQNGCEHPRIRLREFPDIYGGWGGAKTCMICEKELGSWTRPPLPNDKPVDVTRDCGGSNL